MSGNSTEARRARVTPELIAAMQRGRVAGRRSIAERFWAKVDKRGPNDCWNWTGAKKHNGYGVFCVTRDGKESYPQAHRMAWELAGRELPEWPNVIDHICKNGSCVNVRHLRIASQRENSTANSISPMARNSKKTHCSKGHAFSDDNIAIIKQPARKSRTGARYGAMKGRVCLTCFPWYWKHAVILRERPPRGYTKGLFAKRPKENPSEAK